MSDIFDLTALELGAAIRQGEVSPTQAARAALDRMEETKENGAFVAVTADRAMDRAREIEQQLAAGKYTGPLAGVPMALKDNICTKGTLTTCASKMLERLGEQGAVCLGKVNMDEFAMGSTTETSYYGPTRNPWDRERVPGGSSGGAAAAVAERDCWYAVGSDTGGSIRQPAAYCGVTGMKPTYGAVSRYGLIAYASSLDQMGPLARDAADCAAVLDAVMGKDPKDGTSLDVPAGGLLAGLTGDVRGMKIGLPADCFGDGLDPAVRQGVLRVAQALKARGAELVEFDFPVMQYVIPTYYIIAAAEASSNLSRFDGVKYGWRAQDYEDLTDLYCRTRTQGLGAEVKRRILLGSFVLSAGYYDAYYKKALQVKGLIKKAFDDAFTRCDVMLTPVAPTTAPKLGESLSDPLQMYLSDIYTVSVNLAGLPGLSMPCGFDEKGLPIGCQIIGPPLGEAKVLNAAHAFQLDTDYHKRRPGQGQAEQAEKKEAV